MHIFNNMTVDYVIQRKPSPRDEKIILEVPYLNYFTHIGPYTYIEKYGTNIQETYWWLLPGSEIRLEGRRERASALHFILSWSVSTFLTKKFLYNFKNLIKEILNVPQMETPYIVYCI